MCVCMYVCVSVPPHLIAAIAQVTSIREAASNLVFQPGLLHLPCTAHHLPWCIMERGEELKTC